MKRIICHWSAGGYNATAADRKHYHFIFEGDGREVAGDFKIAANERPRTGKYAAHTYRCNTGSIGLSLACMRGAKERPLDYGPSPMTKAQWDAMCRKAAKLCLEYGIEITPRTVLSHAEVQPTLGIKQRGKWDFTVLPFARHLNGARECGERLRADIRREVHKLKSPPFETKIYPPSSPAMGTRLHLEQSEDYADAGQHLRQSGSRTMRYGDMVDKIAVAGASVSGVSYSLQQFTDALDGLPSWLWPLPAWLWPGLVVAGCAAVFWYIRKIKRARIDDHIRGANIGRPENPTENL